MGGQREIIPQGEDAARQRQPQDPGLYPQLFGPPPSRKYSASDAVGITPAEPQTDSGTRRNYSPSAVMGITPDPPIPGSEQRRLPKTEPLHDGEKRFQPSAADKQIQDIEAALAAQHEHDSHQSYLGRFVDLVWRGDERAEVRLEHAVTALKQLRADGDERAYTRSSENVTEELARFNRANHVQDEISRYGTGFLKTAALFLRGRTGFVSTGLMYALDQARPDDNWKDQLLDGSLGALKGTALKGVFQGLGTAMPIAARGVALGMSGRVLDSALTRSTYLDEAGAFSMGTGLVRIAGTTFDARSITSDAIVFGLSYGVLRMAGSSAIARTPLVSMMLTGATFGLSSGASGEIMRQRDAGEDFDFGKVAYRSLMQGAVDTVAAIPGGIQSDPAARAWLNDKAQLAGKTIQYDWNKLKTELSNTQSYDFLRDDIHARKLFEATTVETTDRGIVEAKPGQFVINERYEHKRMFLMSPEQLEQAKAADAAPGESSRFYSEPAKGGELVDTYDRSFVRAKPGELIVGQRIYGAQDFVMNRDAMWERYQTHWTPPATVAGSFLRLMDEMANPPTEYRLDVRAGRMIAPHDPLFPVRKPM